MNNSIVRQTVQFMKKIGVNMTEKEAYQELLKQGFIKPNGEPTKWAIEQGFIGVKYTYPDGIKLPNQDNDDKDLHAVLSRMKKSDFIPADNPEDGFYIKAKPMTDAIHSALKDGAISAAGREKWLKLLRSAESSLEHLNNHDN